MRIQKSDVVLSLAGRDQGSYFFVLDTEEGFVWLADGKARKVEKPKRKKLRHLRHVCSSGGAVAEKIRNGETVTNKELKQSLKSMFHRPNGTEEVC